MFLRIIKNDIKNSRLVTFASLLIITVSAILFSSAISLMLNLSTSIDNLMANAETPHFLQMHSGNINKDNLISFAQNNELVQKYQTLDFLNIDGSKININGNTLSDSVQDNGFCVQSHDFDYLLDLNNNIVNPKDGEIYLPLYLLKDKAAQENDIVNVCGKDFRVAGFIRDSQMNSLLASSKRFLVSQNDYNKLVNYGSLEYLIEFRLKDVSTLNQFENEYIASSLESNGPTITYPLFKMINAISDGLMIAVILLISFLILGIAFMCIRFTLLAKIEDDYYEIGVMKAIGLSNSEIKKIYLPKYAALSGIGCIVGYFASIPIKNLLLKNIELYMGRCNTGILSIILSVLGLCIIFLIITAYVNHVLNRFRKISAVSAMHIDFSSNGEHFSNGFNLSVCRFIPTNIFLGIKDVLTRKKLYILLLIIFILSSFIMIVPQNMYSSISSRDFITYMGIGDCDMRMDIQQSDNIEQKCNEISDYMSQDKDIDKYSVLYTKMFSIKDDSQDNNNIKVELGDHTIFPVRYIKGNVPESDDEIALSSSNAEDLNKALGDTIVLNVDNKDITLTVCGIYSDITNGGKTAKASFECSLDNIMWSTIYADSVKSYTNQESHSILSRLSKDSSVSNDNQTLSDIVNRYASKFTYAKVSQIETYINQTFGSTKDSVKTASYISVICAVLISMFVASLFIKMLISKDRYSIAVMKSIGFKNSDINLQYTSRSVFVLILGIIIGTVFANTIGQYLAGLIISFLGASSFKFSINPVITYILYPAMLVFSVVLATVLVTLNAGKIKLCESIKE